ncbi:MULTISPECIES: acyl-CoA thioesterase [unclassified Ruegeria]|uniref:acyl-CoA thioesterase n=1 Tax=unclassified Ruegeria TaxID=2625375 RepID=UPI001489CB4F|nr:MULTISPECIES: acyl-CoA thioesterase [unclassified Ruegeria]
MNEQKFRISKHYEPIKAIDLRGYGVPEPWNFGVGFRATFGDLDAQNHVSNVKYLRWIEAFRMAYLRAYGWPEYATPGANLMVIRRFQIDYLKPVHLDDDVIVTGRTAQVGRSSCTMEYAIWGNGQIASASAVLVFLDQHGTKSDLPGTLRPLMIEWDGAQPR